MAAPIYDGHELPQNTADPDHWVFRLTRTLVLFTRVLEVKIDLLAHSRSKVKS